MIKLKEIDADYVELILIINIINKLPNNKVNKIKEIGKYLFVWFLLNNWKI